VGNGRRCELVVLCVGCVVPLPFGSLMVTTSTLKPRRWSSRTVHERRVPRIAGTWCLIPSSTARGSDEVLVSVLNLGVVRWRVAAGLEATSIASSPRLLTF